ncbi:MAG: hypothetical protein QOF83_3440 [Solirubrobacteraceae bacterium]|jgi:hypothetical protein|nr:hypothetical protein [Solirubrobacteraceae bacterium]
MNGEDSQSDGDGRVEVDDNVIRLTDWLGPHEELIPFGPGADAEEVNCAPSAADFWSESSGAVQDALTAPDPDTAHPTRFRGQRQRGRATAAAIWGRRRAALQSPQVAGGRPRVDRRHRWAAGAAVVAIATVALVAALAGYGSHHWRGGPERTPAGRQASWGSPAARDMASAAQALRREARYQDASQPRRHPAAARHRTTARRPRSRRSAPASAAAVQPVGYTTPVGSSPTYSPPGPSASSTPTTSTPTTSTSTATASTGQGSGSASQPVLGASGSLAPGSSPDG